MLNLHTYFAFILTAAVIIVIPGPSVLFVIARSVNLGVAGGLRSVCGLALGALCHAVAVSLGLAAILQASPNAFLAVKNAGCFYLLYLGVRTFLSDGEPAPAPEGGAAVGRGILWQGFLVELLNPKTAVFFLVFLPQFVAPGSAWPGAQLLLLGLTFVILGLVSDACHAVAAGRLGGWLRHSQPFRKAEKYLSGGVYCGLGLGGLFYRAARKTSLG